MTRVGIVAIALLLVAACGDDADSADAADAPRYVVRPADGYALKEASDPLPDASPTARVEPTLDWYSEYERLVPRDDGSTEGLDVRVSGHHEPMGDLADTLPVVTFEPGVAGPWEALIGTPVASTEPAIVLLDVDGTSTVMVLSYALGPDELVEWAATLEPASQDRWVAAGGVVDA